MQRLIILACIIAFSVWIYHDNENSSQQVKERNEQLMKNPEAVDLGIVDGCEVKYYTTTTQSKNHQNGYQNHTFYIAKCDEKQTTTITKKGGGRFKIDEATIVHDK
jgi:tyrosine-protein phosphatase YwqE